MKRWLKNLTLLLCGLALACGVFELSLRLIEISPWRTILPVAQISLYGPDYETGYTVRPNVKGMWATENRALIEINADGYRGPRHDSIDIAVFGNSYTEALQVETEETFVSRLGNLLDIKTANFGLSGATPPVYITRLQTILPRMKPKEAIIVEDLTSFYSPDLFNDQTFVGYKVDTERGTASLSYAFRNSHSFQLRTSSLGKSIYWMIDHSRLLTVLNNRMNRGLLAELKDLLRQQSRNTKASEPTASCGSERILELWAKGEPREYKLALDAFLEGLREAEKRSNIPVSLILIGPVDACPGQDINRIETAVRRIARRHDVKIYYLDPVLRGLIPDSKTYVQMKGFRKTLGRGHLNADGHELLAQAIAGTLDAEEDR